MKTVEILAPAGSFESMTAAICAGADAIYIGGSRFGARAYADNPNEDKLLEAIDYAHLHCCKLYLTVNTLVKESELNALFTYLKPYYERGLDAVIVQDLGVFSFIRDKFPDLPIHASTQMTITGVYGARMMAELGAKRIVTARELSLEEIQKIHGEVEIEIESFVHGALCYCYSGQCLLSSLIGGRSGNRGRCAQPCRLPYDVRRDGDLLNKKNEKYVLSLKDLCTLDFIPDMIEAGICSLKIEGRMKSPRYTAGVTSIYRKYVDQYFQCGRAGYQVEKKDRKLLLDLFDRGGFTDGYYKRHNGSDMVVGKEKPAFREGNQELFDYLDHNFVLKKQQEFITGRVVLEENTPACLTLNCREVSVTVMGKIPQLALNQPITEEKLKKQIEKTGNTPFIFEKLETIIKGNVFMPVQELNELRRQGLEALEEKLLLPFRRISNFTDNPIDVAEIQTKGEDIPMKLNVSIENMSVLPAVLSEQGVSSVYLDSNTVEAARWKTAVAMCHKEEKKCLLMLPQIFRPEAERYFRRYMTQLRESGFDGFVIRSLEEVGFLKEYSISLPLVFDATVYTWNHLSEAETEKIGAERITLPIELNNRELEEISCHGKELMGYGYLPVMVSAQCIKKTVSGCDKIPEVLWIKDKMSKEFPVKNHCRFCYNTVYNTTPLSLLGMEDRVKRLKPTALRLGFTIESEEEAREIIRAFTDAFLKGMGVIPPMKDFTRGHFKRGAE